MPGKVKVRILAGRNLPVMDRASDLTDAFAEIKFASTTYKTEVARKSLNPQWNSEWYKFEVEDEDLQDEPLQIRVLDYDTYSAHDAIGKVYIDLDPLLSKDRSSVLSGWFPIYDTMHGIRGELNLIVKVELFSDFNKFRQSSCGVDFFCTPGVPFGYRVRAIHGFVEELAVNDDPEYQWIDKIRSQRASNEARQILFSKLTGELQRKIGLKVLELGGNGVIGYKQCFDLEGVTGAVVRAIGTAVTLIKLSTPAALPLTPPHSGSPIRELLYWHSKFTGWYNSSVTLPEDTTLPSPPLPLAPPSQQLAGTTPTKASVSPGKTDIPRVRRSSESDIGTPPKVFFRRHRTFSESSSPSKGGSSGSGSGGKGLPAQPLLQQQSIEMMEYPFFTINSFPPSFITHLGGVVSARSVKLLDRIHNPDEPETRDAWWMEIRTEIRSHTRAMGCQAVVGYSEQTTICDEIIVLSASGTAARVNLHLDPEISLHPTLLNMSLDRHQFEKEKEKVENKRLHVDVNLANQASRLRRISDGSDVGFDYLFPQCSICHIPYKASSVPFPVSLTKCAVCRKHSVPDVLFTTIESPLELPIVGKGCFIQARLCRPKKEAKGESNAKEISDNLPFMEYELHNQLLNKLKVKGMNMLFGLKIQVTVGERLLVAVATATAAYAAPLPAPASPRIVGKSDPSVTDSHMHEMQRKISDAVIRNKDVHGLYPLEYLPYEHSPRGGGGTDESEEELSDLELSAGNKDTFLLEVDDLEDAEIVSVLLDPPYPDGIDMCNTQTMPGVASLVRNLQMFTRVWRGQLTHSSSRFFSAKIDNLLKSMLFKLRRMAPCALCHIDFDVGLKDEDQVQVSITGMCVGLGEPPTISNGLMDIAQDTKQARTKQGQTGGSDQEEMMFHMDGVSDGLASGPPAAAHHLHHHRRHSAGRTMKAPKKIKYHTQPKIRQGVDVTPLSHIPGAKVEQYLGTLNFFIIRESTSIREEGGLNGFMHCFMAEVMAICRAHVLSLGGNALVSFSLVKCVLDDNLHKNQSQCLVNVCGDVVMVQYETDHSQPATGGSTGKGVPPSPVGKRATPQHSPHSSPKEKKIGS